MDMLRNSVIALLSMTFLVPTVSAAECKATTYGQCHKVRGRYGIYASNDFMWIVGTKHMLVATNDALDETLEKAGWEEHWIYGDFVVCPESPYIKGEMQRACIQSYKNIKLAKRK